MYDALSRWCRDATHETHDWVSHQPDFIAAAGADSPDRSEIAPALIAQAAVIAAGAMTLEDVQDDLGALVTGRIGPSSVASAVMVHPRARAAVCGMPSK
jgi:hypothetical protein